MGLVLVCPQCQAKVLLQSLSCPYCQADLRHVPQEQRRYVLGQAGPAAAPATAAPAAAPAPEPVRAVEAAQPEVRIRRPHVRRYGDTPVAATFAAGGKMAAPSAPEAKPEAKKTKKGAASKKKK